MMHNQIKLALTRFDKSIEKEVIVKRLSVRSRNIPILWINMPRHSQKRSLRQWHREEIEYLSVEESLKFQDIAPQYQNLNVQGLHIAMGLNEAYLNEHEKTVYADFQRTKYSKTKNNVWCWVTSYQYTLNSGKLHAVQISVDCNEEKIVDVRYGRVIKIPTPRQLLNDSNK
ncbi:MAG: hypothetical protein AAFV98_10160 [Chloroflexota bacterium]